MKKKVLASLLHLLISFVLVISVFAFVLLVCYPEPYFTAMGVGKLLIVLAVVDVCLGPLITFIIFDPAKKWLKFDLTFIAVVQLLALAYGAVTVFAARPVYLVFDENGLFTLVSAYQIPEKELKKLHSPTLPMTGPELVGARIPKTREERKKYVAEVFEARVDLPRMLQYHVPYESVVGEVKAQMKPLDRLIAQQPPQQVATTKLILNEVAKSNRLGLDELAFLPMTTFDRQLTVIIRRSDAKIVDILPIDAQR
ncbi:hypothetical protein GN109_21145 [Collimonas pratensis]|uniref:TfpX/TfpZ family type IV pilin accessory protein n=1 Tax=Collimonas pratensis TaxID=279113 RepID=UPI00143CDE28|nr:TfpX/TfpZ family type IV pilin accessory protein [Collimonas pratensis]NKI71934.1 hypothetical protein [Collimonas pratensis]